MNASADDFKRRYESLSDEALLEENRDELTEVARECLDSELAGRGLAVPPPEAEPQAVEPTEPGDEFVPLADYMPSGEIGFVRSLLQSANIPCVFPGEQSGVITSYVHLLVPAKMLEQARELLDAPVSEEELAAEAEAAEEQQGESGDSPRA